VAVAHPATMEPRVPVALPQHEQQTTRKSVRPPNVNNLPPNKSSSNGNTGDYDRV
jgi:hypothetical protein